MTGDIAGVDNWTLQEWTMTGDIAGVDIAGVDNQWI